MNGTTIPIDFTMIPEQAIFVDTDHQAWQRHFQEAMAMGFGSSKAVEYADIKCGGEGER